MVTAGKTASDALLAKRNAALTIALLHVFVTTTAFSLLWNAELVSRPLVIVWMSATTLLATMAFAAALSAHQGASSRYSLFTAVESWGATVTFAAFPWLSGTLASGTPSKFILLLGLVAVTSIAAVNSSHIVDLRPVFTRQIVLFALSYSLAFAVQSEWLLAVLVVAWCASVAVVTRVGYQSMREFQDLRARADLATRYDDLTGLLSRAPFLNLLAQQQPPSMGSAGSRRESVLVLFDLDGFKAVNDAFGDGAGDTVLRSIATRLTASLPASASISRLGGDEFAAIVRAPAAEQTGIIERALAAIAEPFEFNERELYVAASAGWTIVTPDVTPAELLQQASTAMDQSKNSQTAAPTGFDTALRDELDLTLDQQQRFRGALKQSEIDFWAQPLVGTKDRVPVAIELLGRWTQEDNVEIGPLDFSRLAEETGQTLELDRLAIACASDLLSQWQHDPFLSSIIVKANVSPVHLHDDQLLLSVKELVPKPLRNRLGLELVESQLISSDDASHAQLRSLRDMGITMSIDDFGVGYSSLAYLRSLPVSELKIDRSFVTGVDSDRINQGLVRAVVAIASTLGLATVAEGVETVEEFQEIARLGVMTAQGYLFARPEPVDVCVQTLRDLNEAATNPLT